MRNRAQLQANMNVIPFIDIMLVLLIAFMITTPLMQPNLKIQLPQGNNPSQASDPMTIRMHQDGKLSILMPHHRADQISSQTLPKKLKAYWQAHPQKNHDVLVEADQRLTYKKVMTLIEQLKHAGVSGIGLVTQPR